jgi:hypothetical protein
MRKLIKPDALYFGDNGRCLCGACSGTSATYTLRDISGQRIERITPKVLAECLAIDFVPECEDCGKKVAS